MEEGVIQGWRTTVKDSEEDEKGIDYWIRTVDKELPFQIKGYRKGGHGGSRRSSYGRRGSRATKYLEANGITIVYLRKKNKPELKDLPVVKDAILRGFNSIK